MKSSRAFVAAAATVLFLSSCTSQTDTAADGHTDHDHGAGTSAAEGHGEGHGEAAALPADVNDADVAFVTGMIPHHEQAVEMSAMVPQRSTDPAVIKLAADISAAQGPEIETMKAFLAQWNSDAGAGHDGHAGMQGMVDDATMTRLESLRGKDFDTLWLTSMIGHHEGAVDMADTEIADGVNADAKKLAQEIVTVQKAEIEQMRQMGAPGQNG